jgi:hypothetical protein
VTRGLHSNHPGPGTIDKASPELHDQKGARGLDEPVYESEEQWAPAPDGDLPKAREAFKNCRSIKSTIVTRNGIRQKMFVFPDFPIGRIFNVDMGMIEAKGVKYTPITKELILEIGFHRSRQVLYCPEIVDTIDPGEFAGLMLAGNGVSALIGQFVPARQPSVGVVHILKVASGWSKIELLRLDALSLTSMVLAPINDFKHLKSLEIDKPIINTQDLARQPFLCQIKELIFTRFNEQDRMAPICRKLASSDKLQRLQFVSCNVTSDDLLALRACPKLLYLDLEGENMLQLVPAVIQLPHLQEVCFRNAKLSTEQIASITTRKNILRLILSEKEYSESERAQCRYNSHKVSFAKR